MEDGLVTTATWAIDPAWPEDDVLARAAEVLRRSGVVAYPTDTLYGLAVDPGSAAAIAQLYRTKGREVDRAIPLIAADLAQIEVRAGALPAVARRLAGSFWPGPLTLVIEAWPGLADALHASAGTVAIRVPAHAVARGLARAFGGPVTSTSANRSGEPALTTAAAVGAAFPAGLDAVLDGGPSPGGPPSTIVDARGDTPRLVRAGAVPWARVLECIESGLSSGTTI
jgi:L-threonylcarbamoyladenylate synthase